MSMTGEPVHPDFKQQSLAKVNKLFNLPSN